MPILGSGLIKRGLTWAQYVASLPPVAWYKMNEPSGSTIANSGSLGSAINMTATSVTLAQTGKLGVGEAILFNGTTSRLQTANNATLAGYTTWEYVFLLKPATAGEGNNGTFFAWGEAQSSSEPFLQFSSGALPRGLTLQLYNTAPTSFSTVTSTTLSADTDYLVFVAYDDNGDRKVHIYLASGSGVAEVSYGAQNAMTGTYKVPVQPLSLGNRNTTDRTFSGLMDEALFFNRNLSVAQRTMLAQLVGL